MITSFIVAITPFSQHWMQRSISVESWLRQAIRNVRHMTFGSRHCHRTTTHRLIDGHLELRFVHNYSTYTFSHIWKYNRLPQENQSQDRSRRLLDRPSDEPARG